MEHGPLYDISSKSAGGSYYQKYLKYKLKYLKLKKMKYNY
jgi:hypothetical protein